MFSNEFNEFVAKCLVKDPHQRVNSSDLLQNDSFIKEAKPSSIICDIIDLAIRERNRLQQENFDVEGKIIFQSQFIVVLVLILDGFLKIMIKHCIKQ